MAESMKSDPNLSSSPCLATSIRILWRTTSMARARLLSFVRSMFCARSRLWTVTMFFARARCWASMSFITKVVFFSSAIITTTASLSFTDFRLDSVESRFALSDEFGVRGPVFLCILKFLIESLDFISRLLSFSFGFIHVGFLVLVHFAIPSNSICISFISRGPMGRRSMMW